MAKWAGVQNVSRPIPMCQEMSQYRPKVVEVTARTDNQMYLGTTVARIEAKSVTTADAGRGIRAPSAMEQLLRTRLLTACRNTSPEETDSFLRVRGRLDFCGELRVFDDE